MVNEHICRNIALGDMPTVRRLLRHKKHYSHTGSFLYHACRTNQIEIINLLLPMLTDLWCYDRGLEGACEGGHLSMVKFMISKGAKCFNSAFGRACANGHLHICKYLLANDTTHDITYDLAFHTAVSYGHLNIVEFILSQTQIIITRYLVVQAANNGHVSMVRYLTQHPNFRDDNVAFHYEPYMYCDEIFVLLLHVGIVKFKHITVFYVPKLLDNGISISWFEERQSRFASDIRREVRWLKNRRIHYLELIEHLTKLPAVLVTIIVDMQRYEDY